MKFRGFLTLTLLLCTATIALAQGQIHKTPKTPVTGPPVPLPKVDPATLPMERGSLADSMVIATVEQRRITVRNFLDSFYATYMEFRPAPDSAGKVKFLRTMTDKEVLALVAARVNRPLEFEDRLKLRENDQRVLANILFQRMVVDSIHITEADIRRVYAQYQYQIHARHVLFTDRATAERVRKDMIAGKISFADAVKRYSIADDKAQGGDMGWAYRLTMDPELAEQIYELKPGETSPVIWDLKGYHVVQIIERKPVEAPAYNAVARAIEGSINQHQINKRGEGYQRQGREMIGMTYDTTNIRYVASKFDATQKMTNDAGGPSIEINTALPVLSPSDTGLVVARYNGGVYTVGRFMHTYTDLSPMLRPSINDFDAFRAQLDAQVLEPQMAEIARRRGLDKDPLAVELIHKKLEEIRVTHLFQDSIDSRAIPTSAERRKYYDDHKREFVTYERVRYAQFVRPDKAGAEAVQARIRAGEPAEKIVEADSLTGSVNSAIREINSSEHGSPNYKVLLEELKPGKMALDGPDKQGQYQVLYVLDHIPSRDLPYDEVENIVDESVQNLKSEQALKDFVARYRKQYRIVERLELLPFIVMQDPLDRR